MWFKMECIYIHIGTSRIAQVHIQLYASEICGSKLELQ